MEKMNGKNSFYTNYGKRLFDLALTVPGLVVLSPVFVVVALVVWWKLGRPVIFRQQRPGLNGKPFTLYKFRTMTDERDEDGNLLPDKERLTGLGRLLRKSSIDELPELFNVLKGDMSVVGPRPLLPEYLPYYTERERKRHDVLPGITGLAQIEGRNNLDWDRRLELDVQYVERSSYWFDMLIVLKTIPSVLWGSNVVIIPGSQLGKLDEVRRPRDSREL